MGEMPGRGEGGGFTMPEEGGFGADRGGMMGSDDVYLIYTDDDPESYPNIFDNAKTDVSASDEERLIAALKALNEGGDVSDCVDVEAVIRYFVAHNFVCNFDSYTGSMVHNYYLYEEDGILSMLPWDYNLAFGGFMSGLGRDEPCELGHRRARIRRHSRIPAHVGLDIRVRGVHRTLPRDLCRVH